MTRIESINLYMRVSKAKDDDAVRELCLTDLFYLLFVICNRRDINRDWLYERCREVEKNPDGNLDLWAREHYKSSIITFGLTLQNLLNNPELTVGIFSHTRPIAKSFLSQIKRELETNTWLQDLFPDVLYKNPQKESPKWSLDDGIIIKRKGNPKESTVEAWGLVDGQPTSKHYNLLVYDDVVTKESVSTPEMIQKVTDAFSLSLNLAGQESRKRYIGTRYHQMDTYRTMIERGTAIPRIYAATKDGTVNGEPVLLTRQQLDEKLRDLGSYIFASQMLLNPMSDKAQGFKTDWLMFYDLLRKANRWNYYILVDAASEKKKTNDYTVMAVIGLGPDGNYYLVDAVRDRINLTERTRILFDLVRKWSPVATGYEKYGMQSDIEHIKYVQEQEGYRFRIVELGGQTPKNDRIRRLVPLFEQHRFYLPRRLLFVTQEKKAADFIQDFLKDEYESFPVCTHDDMLDCISRIVDEDLGAVFPSREEVLPVSMPIKTQEYDPFSLNTNPEPVYDRTFTQNAPWRNSAMRLV